MEIAYLMTDFYSKLFTFTHPDEADMVVIVDQVQLRVSSDMNDTFLQPFTLDDVFK